VSTTHEGRGLEAVLAASGEPALDELRAALDELLRDAGVEPRLVEQRRLKARVFRLTFGTPADERSYIAKRLKPEVAQRNELVARRWLPAVGLEAHGPSLASIAAAREGAWVWQVYDDIGGVTLADGHAPSGHLTSALVELLAQLHGRFERHPLLGECRLWGGDLGMHFYGSSVRDGLGVLECVRPVGPAAAPAVQAVRARLMRRLEALAAQEPGRARAMAEHGGPETLLHGDLWTTNAMATDDQGRCHVRLIDWDHAAVGPVAYDLSTLLLRFPPVERRRLLRHYRQLAGRAGRSLPGDSELNVLFETSECARLANSVIWPAIVAWEEGAKWALDELAAVDRWFEELRPVLPTS